jgi:hypothetical protein
MKFISSLDKSTISKLKLLSTHSQNIRIRQRAHAIILSSKKFSINDISIIFNVKPETVSSWIDNWENLNFKGLSDKKHLINNSSKTNILKKKEKKLIFDLIKQFPFTSFNEIIDIMNGMENIKSEEIK